MRFTDKEVREYIGWVATVNRDGMPIPRVELERQRISLMPEDERSRHSKAFTNSLLPRLIGLQKSELDA